MIKVNNISYSYDEKPLFSGVSFNVSKGQKVGLAGPNGAGKSTLLKLLTNKDNPSEGKIILSGKISLVPQEVKRDADMEKASTIRDYLDEEGRKEDYKLNKMLSNLELQGLSLDSSPKKLSGGQRTKLALARALINEPDILLLDEPTNFMDIQGKKWVMEFLKNYPKTLILISHDLELMDKSIDKVLSINPQTQTIEEYKGNYTKFKKLKAEKDALAKRKIMVQQKHIKRMEEGLKKLGRNKSKKGARARVVLKRRIEREKENLPELPSEIKKIKVELPEPARVGELPIRAIGINKAFGANKVLDEVNFSILRGERIALIGPNGVGKSTLIKILMGILEPDSGEVVKNENLKVGYYSQEFELFDLNKTVLDTFIDSCKKDERFSRAFLGRYNLANNKVFQKVESLSGGEKTRLAISLLTGSDYNLLILDEPTTYLDVMSQRIILEALKDYKGAMLIVSHTPEFIAELEPKRALLLPENKLVFWSSELISKVDDI